MTSPNNYLLSIITPVYNREDCIEKCLQSVIDQRSDLLEHIVIDDASTDETYQRAVKLADSHNGIRIFKLDKNYGVNFAFNRGIENASGSYILFLGSDDILAADAAKNIFKIINQSSAYVHYLFLPNDKKINGDINLAVMEREFKYWDWLNGDIGGDFVHVISATILKKFKFFEEFRIYEDLNFIRIFKETSPQKYANIIVVVRERNRKDSVSREYKLTNLHNIKDQFNYLSKFLSLCYDDLLAIKSKRLQSLLRRAIIIGIVLGNIKQVNFYIDKLDSRVETIFYNCLKRLPLQKILFYAIYLKSKSSKLK